MYYTTMYTIQNNSYCMYTYNVFMNTNVHKYIEQRNKICYNKYVQKLNEQKGGIYMAKKTIAELEEEIKNLNERLNSSYKTIEKFMSENSQLRDKADDNFKESSLYMQMKKKIKNLETKLKIQDSTINTLKACDDRFRKQKDEFLEEIEQLKNEIEHLKVTPEDDIKKIKYENFRLTQELKRAKQLPRRDIKTNDNENIEELQKKLDRAIERNKAIIKDYAKCSNENEQLKKYIKELEAKQVGRPKKLNDDIVQKVIELREAKNSIRAIAKELNISIGSVANIINNKKSIAK